MNYFNVTIGVRYLTDRPQTYPVCKMSYLSYISVVLLGAETAGAGRSCGLVFRVFQP